MGDRAWSSAWPAPIISPVARYDKGGQVSNDDGDYLGAQERELESHIAQFARLLPAPTHDRLNLERPLGV
jgi:hypothetical protein